VCLCGLGLLVALLAVLQVAKELRIHALEGGGLVVAALLDTVTVSLEGLVASGGVLLLGHCELLIKSVSCGEGREREGEGGDVVRRGSE